MTAQKPRTEHLLELHVPNPGGREVLCDSWDVVFKFLRLYFH